MNMIAWVRGQVALGTDRCYGIIHTKCTANIVAFPLISLFFLS